MCLVAQSCPTLCDPMDCSPSVSSVHEDSPGKNTGMGCHALLQGIIPTQVSSHCRWILYCLSHQGSPRILEWVAYPFSRRSSHPRSQTGVSCIAGGFFTSWATREALGCSVPLLPLTFICSLGFPQHCGAMLVHPWRKPPQTTINSKRMESIWNENKSASPGGLNLE